MWRWSFTVVVPVLLVWGCRDNSSVVAPAPGAPTQTLAEARHGFTTHLIKQVHGGDPIPTPPPAIFRLEHYDAPVGKLAAYVSADPGDGVRHPAIVWITGGDCNSIGESWTPSPADNDQSAAQYRQAGVVLMLPSLRGGNTNPGVEEGFFGELEDILAAADFLAKQPYVDPARIYLGGHSTGGTMALLESEYSARFRAVFSFGPVADPKHYSEQVIDFPYD